MSPIAPPVAGEKWRYKPNRGSGAFRVVSVKGDRVRLVPAWGSNRHKTISLRTLRSDYERTA
jgi:hypothetical protein